LENESPQHTPGFAVFMVDTSTMEEHDLSEQRKVFQRRVCEHCDQPEPDANGMLDPIAAGDFLYCARAFLERELLRVAERYSSAAWLFYLRRLHPSLFRMGRLATNEFYNQDLAEILSGLGGSCEPSPKLSSDPLIYPMDGEVPENLKWFCAGVQQLKIVHSTLRIARKNVRFRFSQGGWPEPEFTETQREAIDLYDDRNQLLSPYFIMPAAGTILGRYAPNDPDSILVVSRIHPTQRFFPEGALGEGSRPVTVMTYFNLGAMALDQLKELSHHQLGEGWNVETGLLWMLLRLAKFMLESRPDFFPSVACFGYIRTDVTTFKKIAEGVFQQLSEQAKAVLPDAAFPDNAHEFLTRLEAMKGSLWPICPGPVLRRENDLLLIDLSAASQRLHTVLEYPKDDDLANARGYHFEDQVQRTIDDSPWGDIPASIRKVREYKALLDPDGKPITDIDAIGARGNTLLIVDCWSNPFTALHTTGDYATFRNQAQDAEDKVRKWLGKREVLLKKRKGRNYDFSAYTNIVAVVCTTTVPYVEPGITRSYKGLALKDLSALGEVEPGLRGASSLAELEAWLNGGA